MAVGDVLVMYCAGFISSKEAEVQAVKVREAARTWIVVPEGDDDDRYSVSKILSWRRRISKDEGALFHTRIEAAEALFGEHDRTVERKQSQLDHAKKKRAMAATLVARARQESGEE